MPRAAYSFGVIFVPENELAAIVKELCRHGKGRIELGYHTELGQFVFENVDNNSVNKSIREILWEAGLIYDAARDSTRLDPVAGRL